MKMHFLPLLTIFFIIGCNDNNNDDFVWETDIYYARFYYGESYVKTQFLDIINKFDNSVIINDDTLEMTLDSIKGNLKMPWSANGLNLKGKYTGDVFKLNFEVDGTFTESGHNHGGSYTNTGTFSIKIE